METVLNRNEVQKNSLEWNPRRARQLAYTLATGMTVLIYFLISLGGLVRNEGAGLSCPDWPLCFGKVVPPMNYQVFLEWFHRLIAGSVSVSFLVLGALLFSAKTLRTRFTKHWFISLGLLMSQVVLGGLTVLGLLSPKWVSSHLVFGLAFFSSILLLTLRLYDGGASEKNTPIANPKTYKFSIFVTAVLSVQILLGGLVSSNYAGLACSDFPTCQGMWIPPLQGLVTYQVLHRIGALTTTLMILGFVFYLWSQVSNPDARLFTKRSKIVLWLLPVLLGAQLSLGIGAVLFHLPLLVSVAHLAVAVAMLGSMMLFTYEVRRAV